MTPTSCSLRDPDGVVVAAGDRVLRLVRESGLAHLEAVCTSPAVARFRELGLLVGTKVLDDAAVSALRIQPAWRHLMEKEKAVRVLEHEVAPFPAFPYEWAPEMLHRAASLTLDFAEALLPEGLGLKDATPYNILFWGCRPVFIDLLSIEPRRPDDPIWRPHAQFVRTFLLPLAVHKHLQIPLDQIFATRRDGLEPKEVYDWCGWWKRMRPPFLSLVSIPAWLSAPGEAAGSSLYRERATGDPAKTQFILRSLFRRLRRTLRRLTPEHGRTSAWSGYSNSNQQYSAEEFQAKRLFVQEVLREFRPAKVLDVGCNTGSFSEMVAQTGASVVAVDTDPVVVGELFRRCGALDVLPLAVNVARPSPALGWRNQEHPSFLERARGSFDAVLMLAVAHHLLVQEGIPLEEIASLAAVLTSKLLLIEFVGTEDPMFQQLARGRDAQYAGLTGQSFEAAFSPFFQTLRRQQVHRHRLLYLMGKRGDA